MINYKLIDSFVLKGEQRKKAGKVVVTNGCFDIIHRGHVDFLCKARMLGAGLIVGVNGDESVRKLKGKGRPINNQEDRAAVLSAFYFVDFIHIFEEERATNFLTEVQPDIYVKAGDYSLDTMHPAEREVLESIGSEIVFLPFLHGKSTTKILENLKHGTE